MILERAFGEYRLFTLSTEELELSVTDLGATVQRLRYRGKDCILGYDSPEEYLAGGGYLGASVGRVGNRIGGSAFTLNGVRYALAPNEGPNQLHGGPSSYDRRRWDAETPDEHTLRFSLFSPDGDNGYPGNLRAWVLYRVEGGTLRIEFGGESDRDTVYAPTNHMYFDLGGVGKALDMRMQLWADRFVETGEGLIPTGRLLPAEGAFDFRQLRPVTQDFDHAFVLTGEHACTLEGGGLRMELFTDFPALQVYTGSGLCAPHRRNQGLALEPEFLPDSPNHPGFSDISLRAGERFSRWAEYRFSSF